MVRKRGKGIGTKEKCLRETDTEDDDLRECRPNDGNVCFFSLRGDVWGDDVTDEDGGGVALPLPLTPGEEGRGTSEGVGSGRAIASGFDSSLPFAVGSSTTAAMVVGSAPLVVGASSGADTGACVDGSAALPFVAGIFSIGGAGVCVDG